MDKLFAPIRELVGSLHGLLKDAADKIWSLVKPVALIGLVFDLFTGQFGWITQLLEHYRTALKYTAETNWLVLLLLVFLFASVCKK